MLPELEGLTPNEIIRLAVQNHEEATATTVSRQIGDLPSNLSRPIAICLYRIVQEGLNNAFQHGNAIGQRVEVWTEAQSIVIVVSDRGPGVADRESYAAERALALPGYVTVSKRLKVPSNSCRNTKLALKFARNFQFLRHPPNIAVV